MKCTPRWIGLAFWFLIFLPSLNASVSSSTPPVPLSQSERDSLRYRLDNLLNEVELLIRNRQVDQSDLKKQQNDLSFFKVYERIPFSLDLPGIKKALTESAQKENLTVKKVELISHSRPSSQPQPIPSLVITGDSKFRFQPDQVTEAFLIRISGEGPSEALKPWIQTWPTHLLRWVELDSSPQSIRSLTKNHWELRAKTYRFREIQPPTLKPRNPRELLPVWARQNPEAFAQAEPLLWKKVLRIESLIPDTYELYQTRSQFLLNDARLSFYIFISKKAGV